MKDIPANVDATGISITDEKNKEINIIVVYRKPGINLIKKEWLKFLEQFTNTETIITGDFNAHNRQWNCSKTDRNGILLEEAMWENDMYVINDNTMSYLSDTHRAMSNIDLIFTTENLVNKIKYEQIEDTWGSDHHPIKFGINRIASRYQKKTNKTSTKRTQWSRYEEIMKNKVTEFKEEEINEENVLQEYKKLVKTMKEAVIEATPGRKIKEDEDSKKAVRDGPKRKSVTKD